MTLNWKSIQSQLRTLRCYAGRIDGIAGPITKKAVRAFQKLANLSQNGDMDDTTYATLQRMCPATDYSVMTSARLIEQGYKVKRKGTRKINKVLERDFGLKIESECPEPGVEAYMLNNRCLLIPGSNSVWDYIKFNLRLLNIGMPRLGFKNSETETEEASVTAKSGIVWHQGFFTHANYIYDWIGPNRADWPVLVIGHSLGAASAQILSTLWSTPSIGFAAPRLRKSKVPSKYGNLSLSICRVDDPICRFPKGFERMGETRDLAQKSRSFGLNHKMSAYIRAMNNPADNVRIPHQWGQ